MPGEKPGEQVNRPLLEGFRQKGMIGIAERVAGDLPCRLPVHAVFVDEKAHQFSNAYGGVGIVELDGKVAGKLTQVTSEQLVKSQHVLERAGNEEILLLEPQLFALDRFIVGVEHLGDVF